MTMPLPDILPHETWRIIVEVGGFSDDDLTAMLAVAPRTTAKGMHDAAFSSLFSYVDIDISYEYRVGTMLKLHTYLKPESLPLRSAARRVNVCIPENIENDEVGDLAACISRVEDLIFDVLMNLPTIAELTWDDGSRFSENSVLRRIQGCLPQLEKLSLINHYFEHSLDFRATKALRSLSVECCSFDLCDGEPWILSDGGLRYLAITSKEDTKITDDAEPSPINIFSSINLTDLSGFSLALPSLSSENLSCLFPKQTQKVHQGLGGRLHTLKLANVDYEIAMALGFADVFPSLYSCSLTLPDNRTALKCAESIVDILCVFLSRHTSLETLTFGLPWDCFDLGKRVVKCSETAKKYDLALCSGNFGDSLKLLEKLRSLNLIGFHFSPNFIPPPLANLVILTIRTCQGVLITKEVARALSMRLQGYTALQLFSLYNGGNDPLPEETFLISQLKQSAPQIVFAELNDTQVWLQSDSGLPEIFDFWHPIYSKFRSLF